jgi:hypothetical protein
VTRLAEAEGDEVTHVRVVIDDKHAGHGRPFRRKGSR